MPAAFEMGNVVTSRQGVHLEQKALSSLASYRMRASLEGAGKER